MYIRQNVFYFVNEKNVIPEMYIRQNVFYFACEKKCVPNTYVEEKLNAVKKMLYQRRMYVQSKPNYQSNVHQNFDQFLIIEH